MMSARSIIFLALLLLLACPGLAQQVFIKNQPFEGKVVKEGGSLWVELRPLELALGFDSKMEAEGARINSRLVRTIKQGEMVLVSLPQAAAALGAAVRENPGFGTVDVYMAVKPNSGTAGLYVSNSAGSDPDRPVKGDKVETAAYAFVVPEGMQLTRDPRLIKSFLQAGGPPVKSDFKFDAMVFYKGDAKFEKGAAVFAWFNREVPKSLANESTLLSYQQDMATVVLDDMGVELVRPPEVMETEGQLFVLAAGVDRSPPHGGTLLLLRMDAKKKRIYQVLTANITQKEEGPTNDFLQLMSTVTTR